MITEENGRPRRRRVTPSDSQNVRGSTLIPRRREAITARRLVIAVLTAIAAYGAISYLKRPLQSHEVVGHVNFGDGRKTTVAPAFIEPQSLALQHVNVMLGNGGPEPDLSGGMIPAVAPPFAMTRWTAQTRLNYVSMCPYNQTDTRIHGFIGTHQPAVWMGESGPVQIAAGMGQVVTEFSDRGLPFSRADEYASANYYRNVLHTDTGRIIAELSAIFKLYLGAALTTGARAGHLRFTFDGSAEPHIILDASRASVITNKQSNVTFPLGRVVVDVQRNEVAGWNDERQDRILVGEELPAASFKGYFVARFSEPFARYGTSLGGRLVDGAQEGEGAMASAWVTFPDHTRAVDIRVGVSFISVAQARRNIDLEIPDGQSIEATSRKTRAAWSEKLDGLTASGATPDNLTVLYTSFAHTLVYPYEVTEHTPTGPAYYSGYLDRVVSGQSYTGYSIWDTFRAQTAWLLLVAPERVGGMVTSMLQDYQQGGWLPMWKNIVETNIMVGTHADSIIAQAMKAGVVFDYDLAWKAVKKDAFVAPDLDTELRFSDREEHTPQEVRAGLTEYVKLGYVAADMHSESGSRTLDYAYDDHAAAIVARLVGAPEASALEARAQNYRKLWNARIGFMEARNSDGSWAGETEGWTEGDHWAYTLNVMHDVPGLIELMGSPTAFIEFLDRHFAGGHNLHTNEPSHHIPYLYALAGDWRKTQDAVRHIASHDYNHTDIGLSGNEDCGQMSAWYLFSALGLYPVDPANATYVFGVPLFDNLSLRIKGGADINVSRRGTGRYATRVTINDEPKVDVRDSLINHGVLEKANLVFDFD